MPLTSTLDPVFSNDTIWNLQNGAVIDGEHTTRAILTADGTSDIVITDTMTWDLDTFAWKNHQFTESGATNAMSVELRDSSGVVWRWLQSGTNWNCIVTGTTNTTFTYDEGVAEPYFRLRQDGTNYYFETDDNASFSSPTVRRTGSVSGIATTAFQPRWHIATGGAVLTTQWIIQELNGAAAPVDTPTQLLIPSSDLAVTGWATDTGATTGLYATLDEEPSSDTDYIRVVL